MPIVQLCSCPPNKYILHIKVHIILGVQKIWKHFNYCLHIFISAYSNNR